MLYFGPFFKGVARIVLLTFYCQTLWSSVGPTVAFAMDGDVMVMRPISGHFGAGHFGSDRLGGFGFSAPDIPCDDYDTRLDQIFWADQTCLSADWIGLDYASLMAKLASLEEDEEGKYCASSDDDDERPSSPTSSSRSSVLSHSSSLSDHLSEKSASETDYCYDGQVYTWSSSGYTYRFRNDGTLSVSLDASFTSHGQKPTSVLSVCNPFGAVILEDAQDLDELLIQASGLKLQSKNLRIGHLGVSFSKFSMNEEAEGHGIVTLPVGATLRLGSATLNGTRFINQGTVLLDSLGVVHGTQGSFVNEGALSGNCLISLDSFQNTNIVDMETGCFWIQDFTNDGDFDVKDIHATIGHLKNSGWMKGHGSIECSKAINRGEMESAVGYPETEEVSTGLEITVNEIFQQAVDGVLTGSDIAFKGKGYVDLGGRVMLESSSLGLYNKSTKIKATDGQEVRVQSIQVGKDTDLLYVEESACVQANGLWFDGQKGFKFHNHGVMTVGTLAQTKGQFVNDGKLTVSTFKASTSKFHNKKNITITGNSTVDMDEMHNEGTLVMEGPVTGRVGVLVNQGIVKLKKDVKVTGTRLVNEKDFEASAIFDWSGETLQNKTGGFMALFDNRVMATRQIINQGLLVWTHNTFKTWHFLNMGWAEMTKSLAKKAMLTSWKVPVDKSTGFKKGMVENRGVLKLAPTDYQPRMTIQKGCDFEHWMNGGQMHLPSAAFNAKTFKNAGDLFVEGRVTGQVEAFQNTKKAVFKGPVHLAGKTFSTTGTMTLSKAATLTVDRLETGGQVTVLDTLTLEDSDWANQEGSSLDIGRLLFKGKSIANDGAILIRELLGVSPYGPKKFSVLKNGSFGKRHAEKDMPLFRILKGGASFAKLSNFGKLVLEGGTYGFQDFSNSGVMEVDTFLPEGMGAFTLQGKIHAKSLSLSSFKGSRLINRGNVTFDYASFRIQSFANEMGAVLKLFGYGTATVTTLDNKGTISLNGSSKVDVTTLHNDTGTLESSTENLRFLMLDAGQKAKSASYHPTIQVKKGTSHIAPGKLKAKKDLLVEIDDALNVAYYLQAYGDKWQCGGDLCLYGDTFWARWDTTYAGGAILKIRHFQNPDRHLKFRSLKIEADQFENGLSNMQMGYLETCMDAKKPGASTTLDIIVKGDLDNRYGKLFGHGETTLQSIEGTVLAGESVDETRMALNQWSSGNHISYPYYSTNESFIASNSNLTLWGQNIFLKLAHVKSRHGRLGLAAEKRVHNLASDLYGKRGIIINGERFDHEIFGTDHSTSGSHIPHGQQSHLSYTFYKKYQRSKQPSLRSLGDIRFNTMVTRNYGGVILAAKSVIDRKGTKWKSSISDVCPFVQYESQELPCHWNEHGQGGATYHGGTECVPAIVQAGEHVMIEAPVFGSSGYVSGGTFTLEAAEAAFQYMGSHAQVALQTLMDLGVLSVKCVVEPDVTADGLVTRQADGTVREKGDSLAYASKFSKSRLPVLGRSHLGVPSGAKLYVTVSCEIEKLLQMMAFTMGRVHDQGLTTEALYDEYIQEGQRQAELGALIDIKTNRSDKPFLVWALEKVQHAKTKEEGMLAVMNLFVPEAFRYQGRSGEARAQQKVSIQTEDDLILTGGKLRSDEDTVTATVGGSFQAQAHVETLGGGDVYHQTATPTVLEAPKARVDVTARQDVVVSGIRGLAKDHIGISGQRYTDRATRLEANTVVHSGKKKSSIHTRTHDVSVYETTGDGSTIDLRARSGALYTEAPRVTTGKGGKATLTGHGVMVAAVQDEVTVQSVEKGKSGGVFGGSKTVHEHSHTSKARGAVFNNTLAFVDLSDDLSTRQGITLVGVDGSQVSRVLFESSKGMVQLLAGLNAYSQSRSEHSKSVVWQRASCDQVASTDYVPCTFPDDCEFDVKTQMPVVVEQIRGQTLAWLEPLRANLEKNGGSLNVRELDPIYTRNSTKQQGPTAALSMMAALAITLATAGSMGGVGSTLATQMGLTTSTATGAVSLTTAGSIVQGMTAATLTSLCVSAGNSVLNNTHNPTKAFEDFLSDKTWVGALKAGSIGGATAGLGSVFGVPQDAATLGDRALKGVVNTVATTGVHGAFGESPEDALKAGVRAGFVAVVQGTLAHKIGDHKPNVATGLALHGMAGGLGGVILGGRDGMLPGAVGAMVGEGVAEYRDDATLGKFMGAVSGAVVDLAQGGDGTKGLAVATLTASTAVEENYERHRTCAVPKVDEEAEAEPPLTPRSKARKLAQDKLLKAGGAFKDLMPTDHVGDHAYDQVEQDIAVRAAFKQNRGETLTDYETGVLHDYRLKHGIILGIAVAAPVIGNVIGKVASPFFKGFQAAKKAMGRGSVERFVQSPKNAAVYERYKAQLRVTERVGEKSTVSQAQLKEILTKSELRPIAGPGSDVPLRDAPRLANQYGGKTEDWVKVKSFNHRAKTGETFEVHAYKNTKTGQVVEPKTKIQ